MFDSRGCLCYFVCCGVLEFGFRLFDCLNWWFVDVGYVLCWCCCILYLVA